MQREVAVASARPSSLRKQRYGRLGLSIFPVREAYLRAVDLFGPSRWIWIRTSVESAHAKTYRALGLCPTDLSHRQYCNSRLVVSKVALVLRSSDYSINSTISSPISLPLFPHIHSVSLAANFNLSLDTIVW